MPIDVNLIRAEKGGDPDAVRRSEKSRGREATVDKAIAADSEWRKAQFALEQQRMAAGKIQKRISDKKKATKGQDPCTAELAEKAEAEKQIAAFEAKAEEMASLRDAVVHKIGNIVDEAAPNFKEETHNPIRRTWGTPRMISPDGKTKGRLHHYQVMQMLGMYDAERGAKVCGHRGYFLRGAGVMLNMALMNYGIAFLQKKGYIPMQPPFFMMRNVMAETAELGDFHEQLYKVSELTEEQKEKYKQECAENKVPYDPHRGEHYLIATSEQPISAFHRKETLEPANLPIRYAGMSSCFRKEAGSHGRDVWGLFRIHQFEKIEQFCYCKPEESKAMHDEMVGVAEEFYQSLEIPYRVVEIVTGALNDAAARKYDLEAWFPGYEEFKELVSCSNCTDYQARALQIKCGTRKQGDDAIKYCHMLNGTLCATERAMCCIVENYQTDSGLRIPRVLQPFMGGTEFLPYIHPVPEKK
jgi:seryl-tRNA synthetase